MEVRACYFLASVYSLVIEIPAIYCVLSNYSQEWAGWLEECLQRQRKIGKKRSLFVVMDWVKMVSEETSDFISPVLGLRGLKSLRTALKQVQN